MRNVSSDSVSSQIVSTSEASERINNVSQLSKTSLNCCPKCNSVSIKQQISTGEYVCNHCKIIFSTPGTTKLRTRKCCPSCKSVSIERRRSRKEYHCTRCDFNFHTPTLKLIPAEGVFTGRKLSTHPRRATSKKAGAV